MVATCVQIKVLNQKTGGFLGPQFHLCVNQSTLNELQVSAHTVTGRCFCEMLVLTVCVTTDGMMEQKNTS